MTYSVVELLSVNRLSTWSMITAMGGISSRAMIFQLRHYCPNPNCGNLVDFEVQLFSEIVRREPDPNNPAEFKVQLKPRANPPIDLTDICEACGLARCPMCADPLLIVFRTPRQLLIQATQQDRLGPQSRLLPGKTVTIVKTYPETKQPTAHPTWPEKIQKPFVDLQQMLSQGRHPSFIISGCRTVLDVATKHLGAEQNCLVDRIDELAEKNIVTGILKDWAHKIRLDGNVAVHDLEGTEEDAAQLVEFMKLFLHVVFELPKAISAKAPPDDTTSPPP